MDEHDGAVAVGLEERLDREADGNFFTAAVLGSFLSLRAKAPPAVIRGAVQAAQRHLDGLKGPANPG